LIVGDFVRWIAEVNGSYGEGLELPNLDLWEARLNPNLSISSNILAGAGITTSSFRNGELV